MIHYDTDDEEGGEALDTIFRDMILLALAGFIAILILVLPFINPEAKKVEEGDPQRDDVKVEVTWSHELDTDVDTWMQAPGDVPVGYSNKGGISCNLLRDDLGHQGDVTNVNYENINCRGILPGEYTVNLHLFRNLSNASVIPVRVVLSVRPPNGAKLNQILMRDVQLLSAGEEITVFRFALNKDGTLVKDSVTNLFKQLRAHTSGGGEYGYP